MWSRSVPPRSGSPPGVRAPEEVDHARSRSAPSSRVRPPDRCAREPQRERRASGDAALDGEVAAEGASDPATDREPEADATRRVRTAPRELFEDQPLLIRRDPGAGVRDIDRDPLAGPERRLADRDAHDHAPAFGVLHRVRDEVAEDLPDAARVARD